jgi:hypothetical protein
VKSDLWLLNFTVDFVWSAPFDRNFAFTYGMTTGLSLVFGDLHRVMAYPGNAYKGYNPCSSPTSGPTGYCVANNFAFASSSNPNNTSTWYKEPDWFSGGQRPNLYPTFGPVIGLRWKPMHQIVFRGEVGFDLFAGFIFGVSADYGL